MGRRLRGPQRKRQRGWEILKGTARKGILKLSNYVFIFELPLEKDKRQKEEHDILVEAEKSLLREYRSRK